MSRLTLLFKSDGESLFLRFRICLSSGMASSVSIWRLENWLWVGIVKEYFVALPWLRLCRLFNSFLILTISLVMRTICCSRRLWRSRSVALSLFFSVVSAEKAGLPALVSSLLVSRRESSGVVGRAKVAPGGGAGVANCLV